MPVDYQVAAFVHLVKDVRRHLYNAMTKPNKLYDSFTILSIYRNLDVCVPSSLSHIMEALACYFLLNLRNNLIAIK